MTANRDIPGVIAPPPAIFAGFLILGLAMDAVAGDLGIRLAWWLRWTAALACGWACIRLLIGALAEMRRTGTPVEPWKPTTALVTGGVYRHSRNPIYLAMVLGYLALTLVFDSVFALLLVVPAVALVQIGVIAREEPYLETKFGDAYRRYKTAVRPWI